MVVGYVRVSTHEQADSGLGLAAQIASIRSEVERRGWRLLAIERDEGVTGKTRARRPGLYRALDDVSHGKADVLMVAKLDRLTRSLLDFVSIVAESERQGWGLVVVDMGIDTTTIHGRLISRIMAVLAEWEREMIAQRTKDALAALKAQGVRIGRPRSIPADIHERVRAERARGESFGRIAKRLNEEGVPTTNGGRKWYPSTIRRITEQE